LENDTAPAAKRAGRRLDMPEWSRVVRRTSPVLALRGRPHVRRIEGIMKRRTYAGKTQSLSTRLPHALHYRLKLHALEQDTDMQSIICRALQQYFDQWTPKKDTDDDTK
jgi:hypothetical protein